MKKTVYIKNILLILLLALAVFSFASCKEQRIEAPDRITVNIDGTDLPEIKLGGEVIDLFDYRFENTDGFIYVYDGKIYFTETAPCAFETELKIHHKHDPKICHSITVVREQISAVDLYISTTSRGIFPGEEVLFSIGANPSGADLQSVKLSVNKPQYVEKIEADKIILSDDIPLGESILLTASLDNGISASCEFKVTDRIFDIKEPGQLELMRSIPDGYFRLVADIDLSGYFWNPPKAFYGLFDGNGYSISGIKIESSKTQSHGLFVLENFGTIRNLLITDSVSDYATTTGVSPYHKQENTVLMAGVVCGANHGRIENVVVQNCEMKNLDLGSTALHHNYIIISGGVCGINYGLVTRCGAENNSITAHVSSAFQRAYASMGGLVGNNDSRIEYSYSYHNTLDVSCYGIEVPHVGVTRITYLLGGLTGQSLGDFYECIAAGNTMEGKTYGTNQWQSGKVGGLLGMMDCGNAVNCYAFYAGISAIGNRNSHTVSVVSGISGCKNLTSDLWIENNGKLVINYDWKYSHNE